MKRTPILRHETINSGSITKYILIIMCENLTLSAVGSVPLVRETARSGHYV